MDLLEKKRNSLLRPAAQNKQQTEWTNVLAKYTYLHSDRTAINKCRQVLNLKTPEESDAAEEGQESEILGYRRSMFSVREGEIVASVLF